MIFRRIDSVPPVVTGEDYARAASPHQCTTPLHHSVDKCQRPGFGWSGPRRAAPVVGVVGNLYSNLERIPVVYEYSALIDRRNAAEMP
jgi:hypothetical protein